MNLVPARKCDVCGCPRQQWLPLKTIADILGVSNRSLRRLILAGELDASKIGGRWKVVHDSLDAYCRKHRPLDDAYKDG